MKDIDFEELDRAVNSLMGTVPPKKSPSNDSTVSTDIHPAPLKAVSSTLPASSGVDTSATTTVAAPLSATPKQEALTEEINTPESRETSPVQSRGRFMDVVRTPARAERRPFPSSAVSRQGVTLQPIVGRRARPMDSEASSPDPQFDSFTMNPVEPMEDTVPAPSNPKDSGNPTEEPTPLVYPFLPDAKVEKRPLGRLAEPAIQLETTEITATKTVENLPVELAPTETDVAARSDAQLPAQPMPAEFDSKLLAIETGNDSLDDGPAQQPASQQIAAMGSSGGATDSVRTLSAGSIPQQYKVQSQMSEAEPVGAIYDTQPLAHPHKPMPGWLIILAILGILVLGAAGGAAVYYLGLI